MRMWSCSVCVHVHNHSAHNMLPQMRQIHSAQEDLVGVDGLAKGIGREERDVLDDVGCEERSVWEYLHMGQLCRLQ
jgi:hypothetical protein